jgi:hypothetical protein
VAANLDDWIDEAIEVEFVTREEDPEPQKETDYTLEGADERGILLGYQDESDLSDYKIVFSLAQDRANPPSDAVYVPRSRRESTSRGQNKGTLRTLRCDRC